jgi:acetyltransferase-like isoleucine patch superfamily enzyme
MLEWFRSNFLDGLTISSGYVVASETVVNKEVSKKTLIVEGPAKSVKELEE